MKMNWVALALLTAFFYAAYNVFIKLSAGNIHQIAGAVILQLVAALIGGIILLILKLKNHHFAINTQGVVYAAMSGVFVGLAEIASFYVFSKGVKASTGLAIIIGGSVVLGAAMGFVFLNEPLRWNSVAGIVLVAAGILLLTFQK